MNLYATDLAALRDRASALEFGTANQRSYKERNEFNESAAKDLGTSLAREYWLLWSFIDCLQH